MFGRNNKDAGYLTPQFDRQSGGKTPGQGNAGLSSPGKKRKPWMVKATALLLAGVAVAGLAAEGNYRYYDYKGRAPLGASPQQVLDGTFHMARAAMFWAPGVQKKMDSGKEMFASASARAADAWGNNVHNGYIPITRFPDHVTFCIPRSLEELRNPAPGSPEAVYLHDLVEFTTTVARRHAQPGVKYSENGNHNNISLPQSGAWVIYADRDKLDLYKSGQRLPYPAYELIEYNAFGHHLHCGTTTGHMDGAQNYNSYLANAKGEFFPVAPDGRIIHDTGPDGRPVPPGAHADDQPAQQPGRPPAPGVS